MKDSLPIVTRHIDNFVAQNKTERLAAIIGGRAAILHGVPRVTIGIDILLFIGANGKPLSDSHAKLSQYLQTVMLDNFKIKSIPASQDITDPLRHDLILISDQGSIYKKLNILFVHYKWELECLKAMSSAESGPLMPFPIPGLVGMKLRANGLQDQEDIRQLFLLMSDEEKKEAHRIAKMIRRDKNLTRILEPPQETYADDDDLETI